MELAKEIKKYKPNVKDSSIKMYVSNVTKINKMLGNDNFDNLDFLNNKEDIINLLKDKSEHTQKNYFASIVVALGTSEKYEDLADFYRCEMLVLIEDLETQQKSQIKTENQAKNWIDYKALLKVSTDYKKEIDLKGLLKKDNLTKQEFNIIQMWVVSCLYVLDPKNNPPLRSNYIMQIVNQTEFDNLTDKEKETNNYLLNISRNKKIFHVADYKTAGTYGVQSITVGKKLNSVLNIWFKINMTDELLLNNEYQPFTPNGLTKYIIKTFSPTGKQIGCSMIRHIIITHLFPPNLTDKAKIANLMMHSQNMQTDYAKK